MLNPVFFFYGECVSFSPGILFLAPFAPTQQAGQPANKQASDPRGFSSQPGLQPLYMQAKQAKSKQARKHASEPASQQASFSGDVLPALDHI